jgi:hypothetical protein
MQFIPVCLRGWHSILVANVQEEFSISINPAKTVIVLSATNQPSPSRNSTAVRARATTASVMKPYGESTSR